MSVSKLIGCDLLDHVFLSEVLRCGQYLLCWIDSFADSTLVVYYYQMVYPHEGDIHVHCW